MQRNFISLIDTGQNRPTIGTVFGLETELHTKLSKLVTATEKLPNEKHFCPV